MVIHMTLLQASVQYIERIQQLPSLSSLEPNEARKLKKKAVPKLKSPLLQSISDHLITVRDGEQINIRIYRPKTMRKLPVIVYYHGGGWVINDINTSHDSCIQLAHQTEHIVVSVNYRLAPEYKFPTPVYDAFDAFQWVRSHAEALHATNEISVAGDSAGGNLAAAVALLATQQSIAVENQLLLYPVTDLSFESQSYYTFGSGFGLDRDLMKWFGEHYVRSNEDYTNPLVSPLLANVSNAPRTFIIAAQYDVLRDEAFLYEQKLKKYGVDVQLHEAKGLVHSYFTNNDLFEKEITETISLIRHFLQTKKAHNNIGA